MFGQATLGWKQNPEADLFGYRIYCGLTALSLSFLQQVAVTALANPAVPSVTITNFPFYGQLFFAVTAYDTSNNESSQSAIVSLGVAPKLRPMAWP